MPRLRIVAAIVNVRHAFLALGISALAISQTATGAAQSPQAARGDQDYKHDTSKKLTDIPPKPYAPKKEHEANRNPRRVSQHKNEPDTVVETTVSAAAMPSTDLSFNGIGFPGVACNCAPPDTNGEVGDTQYVQIVNEGFQVFNKSTGASVLGPVGIETLWSGFGGLCETAGHGDPIVNYDQIANRWVVSQFAGASVPTDECIAVSTTSDATGSYHRYAFHLGSNFFDYPKLAVWPDAYYMAMNVFNSSGTLFLGPQPFAFNRAAMLTGSPANFVTTGITGGSSEETYLPADLDGKTLPPAGAPNTFVEYPHNGAYRVFHFHPDFVTPANSAFTLFAAPAHAGFTALCPTTRACVPQGGTTSTLDGIGDRFMFRAAYRNFGDHESVVTNYSVSSGGVAGVRWLELRNVTSGPVTVWQESTYQPDSTWRWMGSAAMDGNGNLAVGYSASSASIFPQIRYAGRLATDPLNTLAQGEATLFAGTGSQTGTSNRWGDYSALTVDPVDDCTFWYTTEYYASTTSFNWRTRIGAFKFPTCASGAPAPSLAIAKTADAASVASGSQIGFTVTLTNSGAGAATNVSVNDSLPTGQGISWSLAAPSSGWSLNGTSLTYSAASVAGGTSTSVHVVSATTSASCGTHTNTASFLSGNGGSGASGQASTVVTCATGPVAALTTSNSCSVFATSTPTPLSAVNYFVRGNRIQTLSPNTFYYWVKVNAAAGGNTFTIPQAITSGNFSSLFQEGTSSVFNAACGAVAGATFSQTSVNAVSGNVTVTFNAASAGTHYIGLQLTGSSLKKDPPPSPNTTVHYDFSTTGVNGSTVGVNLVKQ
jgi:uncharacterized repeat protein (TIGR01451 family)